jgi:hypothetical protein
VLFPQQQLQLISLGTKPAANSQSLDALKTIVILNGDLISVSNQYDPLIQLLIVDCGGHVRALEALHLAIGNQEVTEIGVENVLQMIWQRLNCQK